MFYSGEKGAAVSRTKQSATGQMNMSKTKNIQMAGPNGEQVQEIYNQQNDMGDHMGHDGGHHEDHNDDLGGVIDGQVGVDVHELDPHDDQA